MFCAWMISVEYYQSLAIHGSVNSSFSTDTSWIGGNLNNPSFLLRVILVGMKQCLV
ncbi:hypothetical protein RchiOBHm_Chr3g0495331 [Rosa chinensis]|uniref:Uncharacterized protein n=1 Tax=Rosa chinensis TaxID=74649 RepID=A0A2P6RH75_ROSCH|nr:hypothetical protein RchiOBHm_Chr3g0495331 [Rosa chinensis]